MTTDELFERRLTRTLRDVLDSEPLPHPMWSDAPAAERIQGRHGGSRITPLRLLAIAALLAVGAGAAAGGVWLLRNDLTKPKPPPSLDARVGPTLQPSAPPSPEPTAQPSPAPTVQAATFSDGWLAVSMYNGWTNDLYFIGPDGAPRQVVGSDGDTVWEDCPAFSPDGRKLLFRETKDDSSDTLDGVLAIAAFGADGLPVLPPQRIDLGEDLVCPAWSPDGEHVLVEGTSGPHIIDPVALSDASVFGLGGTNGRGFEWGADSQNLFYVKVPPVPGDEPQTPELWTTGLDGQGNQRLLTFETGTVIDALKSLTPTRLSITTHKIGPEDGGNTPLHFAVAEFDPTQPQGVPANVVVWDSDAGMFDQAPIFEPTSDKFAYIRASDLFVDSAAEDARKVTLDGLGRTAYPACLISWQASEESVLVVVSDAPFLDRGVETAILKVSADGATAPEIIVPWGSVGSYASCRAAVQVVRGDWTFPAPVSSPGASPGPSQSLRPKPTPSAPPVPVVQTPSPVRN